MVDLTHSDSDRYPILGILAIIYGLIIGFCWGLILWASMDEGRVSWPATVGAWLTTLVFAVAPVLLIYTGCVLGSSHADARRRAAAAATAAALLGAKAILACSWAFDELHFFLAGWLLAGVAFAALVALMAIPSGAWALVLAGIVARLTSNGSGRARVCGVLALGLAILMAGFALAWIANTPRSVTVTELLTAYSHDARQADAEYRGRCVTVSGKIAERRTVGTPAPWSGTVWINLEAEDRIVPGVVTVHVGDLPFDPRPAGATYQDFTRLTEGQEVTIRGRCTGMTESGVTFERPLIVERRN